MHGPHPLKSPVQYFTMQQFVLTPRLLGWQQSLDWITEVDYWTTLMNQFDHNYIEPVMTVAPPPPPPPPPLALCMYTAEGEKIKPLYEFCGQTDQSSGPVQ